MNKEKIDDILGTFLLANIPEIITQEEFDDVKNAIKDLQKKAELGDHYKHLYSEVKKQKEDVVEYVNFLVIFNQNINGKFSDTLWGQEILELLGEINYE